MSFNYDEEVGPNIKFLAAHNSAALVNIFYVGGILLSIVAYLNITVYFTMEDLMKGYRIAFCSTILFVLLTIYTNIIYKMR